MGSQPQGHPIFISYRRKDAQVYASLIYEFLDRKEHFRGKVFMDINDLPPASRFPLRLKQEIDACDVLVAVIGDLWLELTKAGAVSQNRRDFAGEEIAQALARKARVIPVLVGKASMPGEDELPEPLKELASIQAITLGENPRKNDLLGFFEAVRAELAAAAAARKAGKSLPGRLRRAWGRHKVTLRLWFVEAVTALPVALPTLVVPNALFVWFLTRRVGSYYLGFGRPEYIFTNPATYVQLSLLQSVIVSAYSALWLAVYRLARRRRGAKRGAAGENGDEPRDASRT